jgi:predicted nucleic acid-binding protein
MTSWVVADSGIYLAIALRETYATHAENLISTWSVNEVNVAVPYLFNYEIVSVIRKHVARGTITLDHAQAALNGLLRADVIAYTRASILKRAFVLANLYGRPAAYDALYLALAEQLACEFWTADLRLVNAVSDKLKWVRWIGDFVMPEDAL